MKQKNKVVALPAERVNGSGKRDFHIHLYIVTDEIIKVGDYFYCKSAYGDDLVGRVLKKESLSVILDERSKSVYKKIIATTDQSLMLPLIPKRFVSEYCDANGTNEVMCEIVEDVVFISHLNRSYSREEVEALCRESFAHGWTSWDSNEDYAVTIEKFINNNLK